MAQHGYLREYDEGWDRGDDRDRDRWRASDDDRRERDRGFMFGERDRDREPRGDRDRGFFDRMGDRARDMFSADDRQYRGSREDDRWSDRGRSNHYGREHGFGGFQGDFGRSGTQQGGFGGRGDSERAPRNFSAHPDDHYRSWRDKQVQALDRDYEDYCREREQQFHEDFDSWRSKRQQQGLGGEQQSGSSPEVMELNNPSEQSGETLSPPSPMADATLGTNNSENIETGRGRR